MTPNEQIQENHRREAERIAKENEIKARALRHAGKMERQASNPDSAEKSIDGNSTLKLFYETRQTAL